MTWGRAANFANFPTDHPLYLGVASYEHLEDSDLILLVGGRAPWYPPHTRPGQGKIVAINDNQFKGHMIYQNLHADAYLEGDIAASLQALTQAARVAKLDVGVIAKRREKWTRAHDAFVTGLKSQKAKARGNTKAIDPLTLIDTLADAMPPDTIYVDETITHGPLLRQHLPFTTPQSFFRGFGGLGQGIGTALGVKLAARERPVALLVGDGGFLYNPVVQALGASKQHGLPILIVIFNNKSLSGDAEGPRASLSGWRRRERENASWLATRRVPTTKTLGSHFGFHGERVEQPEKLKAALQTAMKKVQGGTTAILNVVLSSELSSAPRRCSARAVAMDRRPQDLIDARGSGRQHDQAVKSERNAGRLRHLRKSGDKIFVDRIATRRRCAPSPPFRVSSRRRCSAASLSSPKPLASSTPQT